MSTINQSNAKVKATPADDNITSEALKAAGWNLRYFRSVENSWAISVNAIVRAKDTGGHDAQIRAEIDEFHHFHDTGDQDDLLAWLKVIGSPIADEHNRPIFAWDEFLHQCLNGSPVDFGKTTPPSGLMVNSIPIDFDAEDTLWYSPLAIIDTPVDSVPDDDFDYSDWDMPVGDRYASSWYTPSYSMSHDEAQATRAFNAF